MLEAWDNLVRFVDNTGLDCVCRLVTILRLLCTWFALCSFSQVKQFLRNSNRWDQSLSSPLPLQHTHTHTHSHTHKHTYQGARQPNTGDLTMPLHQVTCPPFFLLQRPHNPDKDRATWALALSEFRWKKRHNVFQVKLFQWPDFTYRDGSVSKQEIWVQQDPLLRLPDGGYIVPNWSKAHNTSSYLMKVFAALRPQHVFFALLWSLPARKSVLFFRSENISEVFQRLDLLLP